MGGLCVLCSLECVKDHPDPAIVRGSTEYYYVRTISDLSASSFRCSRKEQEVKDNLNLKYPGTLNLNQQATA